MHTDGERQLEWVIKGLREGGYNSQCGRNENSSV